MRSDHFDLGVVLNDGLDCIIEYTWNSNIHCLLLGHDVAGIAVLDVTFKDAGGERCMGCMRSVGSMEFRVMLVPCARRRSASKSEGRGSTMLSSPNRRTEATAARNSVRRASELVLLVLLVLLVEAVYQM